MIDEQKKCFFLKFKGMSSKSNYLNEIFMKNDDDGKNYYKKNEIFEFLVST